MLADLSAIQDGKFLAGGAEDLESTSVEVLWTNTDTIDILFVSQVYLGHSEVQLHQGKKEQRQQTCRPRCCTTELIYTRWSHNRRQFNVLSCESQFSQSE